MCLTHKLRVRRAQNLHTYTSNFCAVPHFVNHNGQQQCHQKSLLPPCHRARSQPASHPKKACYGTRMGLSLEFDPGEHVGRHLKAECAPCVPLTLPFPYCRCAYTYASPDSFCPVCQGAFEKSSTSASGPAGICLLNIGINMMTSTMQVILRR